MQKHRTRHRRTTRHVTAPPAQRTSHQPRWSGLALVGAENGWGEKTSDFSTLRATGAGARTAPAPPIPCLPGTAAAARADPRGGLDIVEYVRAARGGTTQQRRIWTVEYENHRWFSLVVLVPGVWGRAAWRVRSLENSVRFRWVCWHGICLSFFSPLYVFLKI
jgi:hypothetical protein